MYSLILTPSERKAIDWIGNRYANGNDLYKLLWCQSTPSPINADWDSDWNITFIMPEHVAWEIRGIHEQEDSTWPCFAPDLANKMQTFIDSII